MRAVGKTWQMTPNTLPYCKEEAGREIGPLMKKDLHFFLVLSLEKNNREYFSSIPGNMAPRITIEIPVRSSYKMV